MEYYAKCKSNLREIKNNIKELKNINNTSFQFTDDYYRFIDWAACADCAIQKEYWETADELSSSILLTKPFKNDQVCIKILSDILEEINV